MPRLIFTSILLSALLLGAIVYFGYVVGFAPQINLKRQTFFTDKVYSTSKRQRIFFDTATQSQEVAETLKEQIATETARGLEKSSQTKIFFRKDMGIPEAFIPPYENINQKMEMYDRRLRSQKFRDQALIRIDDQIEAEALQLDPINPFPLRLNRQMTMINEFEAAGQGQFPHYGMKRPSDEQSLDSVPRFFVKMAESSASLPTASPMRQTFQYFARDRKLEGFWNDTTYFLNQPTPRQRRFYQKLMQMDQEWEDSNLLRRNEYNMAIGLQNLDEQQGRRFGPPDYLSDFIQHQKSFDEHRIAEEIEARRKSLMEDLKRQFEARGDDLKMKSKSGSSR